jgi:hypothetical protein
MGCSNNCNDITLLTGNDGADGANGSDGKYGGHSSIWKFDPSTAATPASTYLRFNNATYNLVTQIHINDTNKNATDMSAFLTSFNTTGVYGYIRIFKEYDDNIFWIGEITNIVDNGPGFTDRTLTVTHIQSNGTLILDNAVVVTFTPKSAGTGITDFAYAAKDAQTISSASYVLAPGALTYQKLVHTNSTGSTQNYEVTVSFNVGDNTATIPGIDCWAALIVNGVNVYEVQEKNGLVEPATAVSGQGFTIIHGFLLNNVATNIQLANTQTLELQFKKGAINTKINAAALYVRQI